MGAFLGCPSRMRDEREHNKEAHQTTGPKQGQDANELEYWPAVGHTLATTWPVLFGNVLEWYEFSLYGYLVNQIQENFFGGSSTLVWLGFSVTFVARPIGGIFLGWVGDKWGRKNAVLVSMYGMLLGTVTQGLLPTYRTSGTVGGTVGVSLLLTLRFVQGLATGGEITSVYSYMCEHAPTKCLGQAAAMISMGGEAGFFLSSAFVASLHSIFSPKQMMDWGWRIPFVITIVPGIVAVYYRRKIPESELFRKDVLGEEGGDAVDDPPADDGPPEELQKENREEVVEHLTTTVSKVGRWQTLLAFISHVGPSSLHYIGVYTVDFMTDKLGFSPSSSLWTATLLQLIGFTGVPLTGCLIDTLGIGKTVMLGMGCTAASGVLVYHTLIQNAGNTAVAMVACGLGLGLPHLLVAGSALYEAELFPTEIRSTGIGLAHNASVGIVGGFGPLIVDSLAPLSLYAPGIYISTMGMLSFVGVTTSYICHKTGKLKVCHIRENPY